jgi:hypothetical protein
MEFAFTPDNQVTQIDVPFYEDARADFAPYYKVVRDGNGEKKLTEGKAAVGIEMGKLGAIVTGIIPGIFSSGKTKRYGFVVRFMYGQTPGVIQVAGLPMRTETATKKQAVMVQALWNVRDWLKAAVTGRVFNPGSDVLIPYLLVDGKHTIAEYIASTGKLPMLASGDNVIDGEFTEAV